jgi:hypothetical protein
MRFRSAIFRPRFSIIVRMARRLDAQRIGHGLAGQVVIGGTKPAGHQHQRCVSYRLDYRPGGQGLIVRHGLVVQRADTPLRQPGTEPGAVGVHGLAQDQFVADGEYDCLHGAGF